MATCMCSEDLQSVWYFIRQRMEGYKHIYKAKISGMADCSRAAHTCAMSSPGHRCIKDGLKQVKYHNSCLSVCWAKEGTLQSPFRVTDLHETRKSMAIGAKQKRNCSFFSRKVRATRQNRCMLGTINLANSRSATSSSILT